MAGLLLAGILVPSVEHTRELHQSSMLIDYDMSIVNMHSEYACYPVPTKGRLTEPCIVLQVDGRVEGAWPFCGASM